MDNRWSEWRPDGEANVEGSKGPLSHTARLQPGALLGIAGKCFPRAKLQRDSCQREPL